MIQRSYVISPSNDNGKKSKVKNTRAVFEERGKEAKYMGFYLREKKSKETFGM